MRTKYELNQYEPQDIAYLKAHLEQEATNGWFLDHFGNLFLRYHREEAKAVSYEIMVLPPNNLFMKESVDHASLLSSKEFIGWKLVADNDKFFIYRSEESDGSCVFNTQKSLIFKTSKVYMFSNFLLFFCMFLNLVMQVNQFRCFPIDFLSSNLSIVGSILVGFACIYFLLDILSYFLWKKQAKNRIEMNQSIPKSIFKPSFKKVYLFVIMLLLFALIISEQNPKLLLFVLVMYFFVFVTVVIQKYIYSFLRKRKVHPYVNFLITVILCVAVCWFGISFSTQTILYDVHPEVEK